MFEIIKVINSAIPTVEPEGFLAEEGTETVYGCALVKRGGKLSVCKTAETPEYISAVSQVSVDGSILAYPVLDNIIFIAPIKGESCGSCNRGDRVSVLNEDGIAIAVTPDAEGVGEITELSDKAGYVFIKFTK